MPLGPGTRLGPYEIQAALGAGGMGEVYRARDTRLDRTVAIKVLPDTLAADPQFRERFDREARAISSLNHPHICTLSDVGRQDPSTSSGQAPSTSSGHAVDYLVMEYLEGETLADRIAHDGGPQGPPLRAGEALRGDEALQIAIQIADALATAHRAGVIHRDLKPGNIFLVGKRGSSPDVRRGGPERGPHRARLRGGVQDPPLAKLLDFGLAKAGQQIVGAGFLGAPKPYGEGGSRPGESMLPTTPPTLTSQGTILGTFQYMAPEQLEGREADARTDIFAFGAVLYEMLTGRKAFEGKSHASLIGAIMHAEPAPLSSVQPLAPRAVDRLVRKCLAKDPDDRWQTARDLLDELRWIAEAGDQAGGASPLPTTVDAAGVTELKRAMWRRVAGFSAALVLTAALAAGVMWLLTRPPAPVTSRLTIAPSSAATLTIDGILRDLAITPDGTRVIYGGDNGTQLFVRALDALEPVSITKGAPRSPFVSPDGQWVGFIDGTTTLKKIAITGGPAVTIAALNATARGATWLADDTVVFATSNASTGLLRVPSAGGTPAVATRPNPAQGELDHLFPEALPGGQAILFTITARTGGLDAAQIAVLDLETGTYKVLVRGGTHAHYAASGHLLYAAAGALRAVAFDVEGLELRGTPVPVVPDVLMTTFGAGDAAVAGNGTLAYVAGGFGNVQRTLVWVDRQGRETLVRAPARPYFYPRVAPDGGRIAVSINDQEQDVWLWDIGRTTLTRATFEPGLDIYPVWTPDGRRLIFSSERAGSRNLYAQAADGAGMVERLTESDSVQDPSVVSPDGTRVIFHETTANAGLDVMELQLGGTRVSPSSGPGQQPSARDVRPLVQTPFTERNGVISPDGRWLAYEANDSVAFEIYVRPYPEVNRGHWQVSTGGGTRPLWAPSGQELFYLSPSGALMRVAVERSQTWAAGAPTKLLNEGYFTVPGVNPGRTYDISPDGQRFLMIKAGGGSDQSASAPQIFVVQNWLEELKRLVPGP